MKRFPAIDPMMSQFLTQGEKATFICTANHAETIEMFYNGNPIKEYTRATSDEKEFVIESVIYTNTAPVTCVATNKVGSRTRTAYLIVHGEKNPMDSGLFCCRG